MLAKISNANACIQDARVVLGFFASKLAPTEESEWQIGFDATDDALHVIAGKARYEIFSAFRAGFAMKFVEAFEADGVNHVAFHPQLFITVRLKWVVAIRHAVELASPLLRRWINPDKDPDSCQRSLVTERL
ncbi:hypothetical protein [Pseudomonas kairouanensis]|uniref:hypothetical protein n=1 Tax=Pseudomonas kairouanensis TaxID=2293832 RepID=UPI00142ECCE5|nr:hypothetical protein [Pseudomonas kairouanensis]